MQTPPQKVDMSAHAHLQHTEIDEYNTLNLESVQAPEETGSGNNAKSALHDPVFRLVMTGFVTLFSILGIAAALTF